MGSRYNSGNVGKWALKTRRKTGRWVVVGWYVGDRFEKTMPDDSDDSLREAHRIVKTMEKWGGTLTITSVEDE